MSAKIGLSLHWAYQGVIYKELVSIDGKKCNRLICRVVESLENAVFAFIVFNSVLLWLLKDVATDVNCLSNSGQEGGKD